MELIIIVGTYEVNYKKFTGTENLFGGTTIGRKNGDNIHIKIEINNSEGEIEVMMKLKTEDMIIAEQDGVYESDFNVKDGSNYLIIKGKNYSGDLKIEII